MLKWESQTAEFSVKKAFFQLPQGLDSDFCAIISGNVKELGYVSVSLSPPAWKKTVYFSLRNSLPTLVAAEKPGLFGNNASIELE